MFLKVIAILTMVFSLKLEAQQYGGSFNSNNIGDDSENQIMSNNNYDLTVYDICNKFLGFCIYEDIKTVYIQTEYCITQFNPSNVMVVGGLCPYFSTKISYCSGTKWLPNYYSFPTGLSLTKLTNFTCGEYNREGLLLSLIHI